MPLPFVHMAAPVYLKRAARRGPTWRESVLMHAVARIAYHGWVDNIQASWVKLGQDGARQLLAAGVNDLGGTLMDENISRAAGAAHGQLATPDELHHLATSAGRVAVQRTTLYGPVTGAPARHPEARGRMTPRSDCRSATRPRPSSSARASWSTSACSPSRSASTA